jgi:hypothetical protein
MAATTKIYITQNDTEILDYITDAGIKHYNDNSDRILTFLLGDSYNLVIYFSADDDKGFILFKIDNIKSNLGEVSNLKVMLIDLFKQTKQNILKLAISQVEQMEIAGIAADIFKKGRP